MSNKNSSVVSSSSLRLTKFLIDDTISLLKLLLLIFLFILFPLLGDGKCTANSEQDFERDFFEEDDEDGGLFAAIDSAFVDFDFDFELEFDDRSIIVFIAKSFFALLLLLELF